MSATEYNASFARRHGFAGGLATCPHPVHSTLFVNWTRDFQKANGLKSDGYFGDATLAKFRSVVGPPIPTTTVPVAGRSMAVPGLCKPVLNWYADGGFRATGRLDEMRIPTEIVIHESVTPSAKSTFRAFSRRREYTNKKGQVRTYQAGTHLLIDHDGTLYVLGDLVFDSLNHVPGGHNVESIGIEIVNPYEPGKNPGDSEWRNVLRPAGWAHGGEYVCPTLEQCATLATVIRWIWCAVKSVPRKWHGLVGDDEFLMGKVDESRKFAAPSPGIWAHQHIGGHADASFPTLVAFLIIEKSMSPPVAYATAMSLAHGARDIINVGDE